MGREKDNLLALEHLLNAFTLWRGKEGMTLEMVNRSYPLDKAVHQALKIHVGHVVFVCTCDRKLFQRTAYAVMEVAVLISDHRASSRGRVGLVPKAQATLK